MGATYIPNYISMENCGSNLTNKQTHTLNPKLSLFSVYIVGTRCEGELKVNSVSELKNKRTKINIFV